MRPINIEEWNKISWQERDLDNSEWLLEHPVLVVRTEHILTWFTYIYSETSYMWFIMNA